MKEHSYAANTFNPKWSLGYGTGNQSDDEMAFMCYYNLLRYETDPAVRKFYEYSLSWYWSLERPECNPLFNFVFAAVWDGTIGYPVQIRAATRPRRRGRYAQTISARSVQLGAQE